MTEVKTTPTKSEREARAKRQAEEGVKARAEYDTAVEVRDLNMARLKELRLAKEKADADAKAAEPAPAPRRAKAKAKAK